MHKVKWKTGQSDGGEGQSSHAWAARQAQTFSQGVRFMTHVFVWSFIRFLQGQKQKPGLQSIFQKKIMQDMPEQQLLEFVHSSCEKISSVSTAKLSLKPLITIQKKNKKMEKVKVVQWSMYVLEKNVRRGFSC